MRAGTCEHGCYNETTSAICQIFRGDSHLSTRITSTRRALRGNLFVSSGICGPPAGFQNDGYIHESLQCLFSLFRWNNRWMSPLHELDKAKGRIFSGLPWTCALKM